MEEGQLDAARTGRRDQRRLGLVEHPGRRQEARLLVRIRVAEHHLLAIAAGRQLGAIGRIVEQRVEDRARSVERLARFEERDDVELGNGRGAVSLAVRGRRFGRVARQLEDVGHVRRATDVKLTT